MSTCDPKLIEFKWQLFEKEIEAELPLCGGSQNLHLKIYPVKIVEHKKIKNHNP